MSHLCGLPAQQEVTSIQQSQLQEVLFNVKASPSFCSITPTLSNSNQHQAKVVDCGNAIDVYYKTKLIGKSP